MTGPTRFPLHLHSTTVRSRPSTVFATVTGQAAAPAAFSTPSYSAATPQPRLRIAIGGEWAQLTNPQPADPEPREWKRGTVQRFSPRSRSRMLQSLARIDRRAVGNDAVFVTLTYPREWPPTTAACKSHLEAFRKRVARMWPSAWFYWKLEYQKRGAEHFHLLMFGLPTVNPEWFADAWHDIVKLGNHWHVEYGADVKRMDNWKQAGAYCAKYCAKVDESTAGEGAGRYWGIATRKNRVETVIEAEISEGEFYALRRAFKRIINAPEGFHRPGGSRSGVWARVGNVTVKRLAGWAAVEYHPYRGHWLSLDPAHDDGRDRPRPGNAASNTPGWAAAQHTTTDHTQDSANLPLFDSSDCQRRAAQARL